MENDPAGAMASFASRLRLPSIKSLIAIALIVLVAWSGLVGLRLVRARADLLDAQAKVSQVSADVDLESVLAGEERDGLADALDSLEDAKSNLSGPLMWPAKKLPFIGRQLNSVDALTGAASTAVSTALVVTDDVTALLDDFELGSSGRTDALRRVDAIFAGALVELSAVDLGPEMGLTGQLRDTRNELAHDLNEAIEALEQGSVVAGGLAEFLDGPSTYMLGAANNSEMRAGQGLVLSAGQLLVADGGVIVTSMQPVWERAVTEPVAIADVDLVDRWGWLVNGQDWLLNYTTPRFPASAELATAMFDAGGEPPQDGLLVLDPFALQAVLMLTGPVQAGDLTVSGETVLDLLLHEQYLDVDIDPASQLLRRERLSDIAPAVFAALFERDIDAVELFRALAHAARGRHILAWSADSQEQELWRSLGVSGELSEESLLVSLLNRGPNKLDVFTYVDSTIAIDERADETVVTVTVTVTNRTPPGLPQYVAGPNLGSDLASDWYRGLVTINVPGSAKGTFIRGVDDLTVVGRDGPTRVVGTEVVIEPGETAVVEAVFSLDPEIGQLTIEPMARFPIATWNTPEGRIFHGEQHVVAW